VIITGFAKEIHLLVLIFQSFAADMQPFGHAPFSGFLSGKAGFAAAVIIP